MGFTLGKKKQAEELAHNLLDACAADVIVVRENRKDTEIIFLNNAAQKRVHSIFPDNSDIFAAYLSLFPTLIQQLRILDETTEHPLLFDIQNTHDNVFSVSCDKISWVDDKPATVFYLHDASEERKAQENLYKLAYFDHLTDVPNRKRFKDDFELKRSDIEAGNLWGIVSIFDLDNFKVINDTYGHNTGDILLRRLTEFLENDPAFKGHLYRLGGDEFVLFYAEPADTYDSLAAMQAHYNELLQGALQTYTMPNIEKACTLSMGVSFFPMQGASSSELLRKADIALYKAKAAGRNQFVFFEDQYDSAQKFKDLYINIQPILMSSGRTFGYELIDRGDNGETDEETLNLTEFDRTIDALGLDDLQNDIHYFIHDSNQLLNTTVLKNLPRDKFVIQIHLPEKPRPKDLAHYKKLRSLGYSLSLIDLRSTNVSPELIELADYCKFDPRGISDNMQRQIIADNPKKIFIATKVDTPLAFEAVKKRGFRLFQGFFFEQTTVVQKTKEISPLKVNYLRLIKLTSTDDYVDFQEISEVISSDVALSYKLLKLLNSAAMGLRSKISSISMAVAYLGEENLKKWIAMLAIRGVAEDQPLELVRISLIRAQFGELLAQNYLTRRETKHVFLVGLLSLLHVALEKTREELFNEMPVSEDIKSSLLTRTGPYSDLVSFFNNYEYSNWDEVTQFAQEKGLSVEIINDAYIAAVKWYNDLSRDQEQTKTKGKK